MNLQRHRVFRWVVPFCCFAGWFSGQPAFSADRTISALESACSYDATNHTVLIQALNAELSRIGDAIAFYGSPCGEATVSNTDIIRVTGPPDMPSSLFGVVILDVIAPGFTPEPGGDPEIEIVVEFGLDNHLAPSGSSGSDVMTFGGEGVALNADGDADILLNRRPDGIFADGQEGDDSISTRGGNGTGAPLGKIGSTFLYGGEGSDRIIDGQAQSALRGFGGADLLFGGGGDDGLYGGIGDDQLMGGRGKDRLNGGRDTDSCKGGPGKDRLSNQCERPSLTS
jgi:hypothetical protein